MSRFESTKGNGSRCTGASIALALAFVAGALATTSTVWADGDHNTVPARLKRKDHYVRDAINRMTYTLPSETTLVETCDCVTATCDGGFLLSCGGEVEPYYAGVLNTVKRTAEQTCYVCGCADYATLRATPVCID
jgi:hypothetical protein